MTIILIQNCLTRLQRLGACAQPSEALCTRCSARKASLALPHPLPQDPCFSDALCPQLDHLTTSATINNHLIYLKGFGRRKGALAAHYLKGSSWHSFRLSFDDDFRFRFRIRFSARIV